jgi:tRNA threonylcarbamoyladenosine biosynthesis protein TsaB
MKRPTRLLALDTASAQCSVALLDGDRLIQRAMATARDHAKLLLPMVDEVLKEAGLRLDSLDGIAFGRGPGSFTGVRIAAAVTQGLAAGAGLPVLPVSDLRALAEAARAALPSGAAPTSRWLLACMDARMGELYWALYPDQSRPAGEASGGERLTSPADLLDQVRSLLPPGQTLGAGAGMGLGAFPELVSGLGLDPARVLAAAEPHAADVARLAAFDLAAGAEWQDASAAQPVYLRDKVVQGPL